MHILMTTGGSTHSELALQFGAHLLGTIQTSLWPTILTVIKAESDRERAREILGHACRIVDPHCSQVNTKIRLGHPAEEIIREAEEGQYKLAIVGEKQHHGLLTRFLLGSTAQRVVEHAPCPVIIAKGHIGPVKRVLLCDSGVQDPSLLSRLDDQLPVLLQSKPDVTVLHVMSQISAGPGVRGAQLRAEAEQLIAQHAPEGELLQRDVDILTRLGSHPRPKIRHGLVVDEILAEAAQGDYGLVVIGVNRGEGWRRILLDDLAHQIIVQADRPVLVVR
jgi:nucleotide-binding universal stress UspA family protein